MIKNIPIKSIKIGDRFRKDYGKESDWNDFVNDINQNGLISAIAVRQIESDQYELLAGGRRLRACTELKYETINATIYTGEIDQADMIIIELNENLKRKSLTPREEAEGKLKLVELMQNKYGKKEGRSRLQKDGVSMRDVARMVGESEANFSRDVSLARAFAVMPELSNCKTKGEAYKLAQKKLKTVDEYEAVQKIKERQKKAETENKQTPEDYLANWYKTGDFFKGIRDVGSNTVNLFEIDPPFSINLKDVKRNPDKENIKHYNEIDVDEYEQFMKNVFKEAYRVAALNSWLIVWYAPEPWAENIFKWATEAGWTGRRLPGIWSKGIAGQNNQPMKYLTNSTEYFYYFRKGEPALNKPGRSNEFNFNPVSPKNKIHPTERPIEMIEEIISTFVPKGSIICTPFLGSGNTLLAAHNLDCLAYGWEKATQYKDSFLTRVYGKKVNNKYVSYIT